MRLIWIFCVLLVGCQESSQGMSPSAGDGPSSRAFTSGNPVIVYIHQEIKKSDSDPSLTIDIGTGGDASTQNEQLNDIANRLAAEFGLSLEQETELRAAFGLGPGSSASATPDED